LFDLRYHVASLAAVFLALIIGILVGVGIASQTTVEESERRVLEQRISDLSRDVENAEAEVDLLSRRQAAGTSYIEESYPVVMNGRLRGTRVALLFVGAVVPEIEAAVAQTLADASGPALVRTRALKLPLEAPAVRAALPTEFADLSLDELGSRLGNELVRGGETPLWDALSRVIVEEGSGGSAREVDAVVVFERRNPTALVAGIYGGLVDSGVPVVGVERTDERPTRVLSYRRLGLSTVDSIDSEVGRVALAVLLAGGEEGHYGLKSNATAVVPPLEPLPLAPPPGG
jgi:hypothetical protein